MKPKTNVINILGIPYTVERVPYIDRNEYRAGEINFEAQEIKLLDTLKDAMAGTTFFHELIHGILMGLKFIDESNNEQLVQGLAVGLYQALGNNPTFYNLYQRGRIMNRKQTSGPVASKASKILSDGRSGKNSKTVAGSALAQTRQPPVKKKK
jgi:hypothetical protein